MNPGSSPADLPALPTEVVWDSNAKNGPVAKEFKLGTGKRVRVKAPWWLRVCLEDGLVRVLPRVCGRFSGNLFISSGEFFRILRVSSSVGCAAVNRWSGASMALASALWIGLFLFSFQILLPPIQHIYPLVIFFLGFTAPCLQLGPWAAGIGGRRFFWRMIGGWIIAVGAFLGVMFILSGMGVPKPDYDNFIGWNHFALLGPPGGIAMATWAACLGRGKLVLPFFLAGLFYPFGLFFGLHWESVIALPHPHIIERALFGAGMVVPMIVFSPWIGLCLPPAAVERPLLSKRAVTTILSVIGCLLFGLGYLYNLQKPSALTIREKPLRSRMAAGRTSTAPMPGEILWEIESPQGWQFKEHVTTNDLGEVIAFTERQVVVIHPEQNTYLKIEGRLGGIGSGTVSQSGRLYFTSQGYVFCWDQGRERWSWGSNNHFCDLLVHPDESVTAVGESQLVTLDKDGQKRWIYPEAPRSFQFIRGFSDGSIIYVLNWDAEVFAIDREGKLLWRREPSVAGRYYASGYYLKPDSAGLITTPGPLLVIGTTNSVIAFNAKGQPQFHSAEPFQLFGCDQKFCYGVVDGHSIFRIDYNGARELVYRSAEPLIDCLVQASEQVIYALTKGKVSRLRMNGQLDSEVAITADLQSLLAVYADHLYGRTTNALMAIQRVSNGER